MIGSFITYQSLSNSLYLFHKVDLYHRGNLNPLFDPECIQQYRRTILVQPGSKRNLKTTNTEQFPVSIPTELTTFTLESCYTGTYPITTDMVIVHYHEDINWINTYFNNNEDNNKNWRKIILSRDNLDNSFFNIEPNIGYEFYSYLWYIVHFYHTLPPSILFLHGHETSWHIFNNHLPTLIRSLNYSQSFININFNRYFWITNDTDNTIYARKLPKSNNEEQIISHNSSNGYDDDDELSTLPWEIRQYRNIHKVWYALHLDRYFGSIPTVFGVHCCGQFYLHRSLIHRLPLSFWVSIYTWLKTEKYLSLPSPIKHRDIGFIFEYLMPFLLHGNAIETRIKHPCNQGYLVCDNLPVNYQEEITPCCTDKFLP